MHIDFKQLRWDMSDPLWYQQWAPIMRELSKLSETDRYEYEQLKERVYDFFEEMLEHDEVVLGSEVGVWDNGRQPIDTAVIHHTSNPPWLTPERLSAIELARLYAPAYASPTTEGDKPKMVGKPISSGHVYDGKQVFWPYHYLVRQDGSDISLLRPSEVGWHAGQWSTNLRSIAITLDGDYENDRPNNEMLLKIGKIIARYNIPRANVIGHNEVKPERKLSCPSNLFLSTEGRRGWKEDLLELLPA
jgi:hypothetical protein